MALIIIEILLLFTEMALSFPVDIIFGATVAGSTILVFFSDAFVTFVIIPELSFGAFMAAVIIEISVFYAFVALAIVMVLLLDWAFVALSVILKLLFRAFVAATIVEELFYFAFVALAFVLNFTFWANMADVVIPIESLSAIMASSLVVDWSLFAALDSALSFNVLISLGATFTSVVNLIFLTFRAFSAL